jgi:hypothetical protein
VTGKRDSSKVRMRSVVPSLLIVASALALTCATTAEASTRAGGTQGGVVSTASATLHIGKIGTGHGTITSSPAGINCGTTCSKAFPTTARPVLTATPVSGSAFLGWSVAACGVSRTCAVSMASSKTVTVHFAAVPKATAGNRQVTLTWWSDAWPGLGVATDYLVQKSVAGGPWNGTSYRFRIAAKHAARVGHWYGTAVVIPRVPPANVRTTNWANASYRVGCPAYAPTVITLTAGSWTLPDAIAPGIPARVDLLKVQFGDVTGDGHTDAVVTLNCAYSADGDTELVTVFADTGGRIHQVGGPVQTSLGVIAIRVGSFTVENTVTLPTDMWYNPTGRESVRYALRNGAWTVVARQTL